MIKVIETDSVEAICPHCNKTLLEVIARKIESTFGVRFIYLCSHCKKVLGVSHRKGFWMG